MDKITAEQIIGMMDLKKLQMEGGYFRETHRSDTVFPLALLDDEMRGERSLATAIYYLLTPDQFSEIHRIEFDEIFHFYLGDPVEMVWLNPDGSGKTFVLGNDIRKGQTPQLVVPGGVWQGASLIAGGEYALMGTTVSPGFDYSDYVSGNREELVQKYPEFRDWILKLTRIKT